MLDGFIQPIFRVERIYRVSVQELQDQEDDDGQRLPGEDELDDDEEED